MLDITITKKQKEEGKLDKGKEVRVRVGGLSKAAVGEQAYKAALEQPPEKKTTWPSASSLSTMIERSIRSEQSKTATAVPPTEKPPVSSTSTAGAPTTPAVPASTTPGETEPRKSAEDTAASTAAPAQPPAQPVQSPAPPTLLTPVPGAHAVTTPQPFILQRTDMTITGHSTARPTSAASSSKTGSGVDVTGGPVSISAMRPKKKTSPTVAKARPMSSPKGPKKTKGQRSSGRVKKSQSISSKSLSDRRAPDTSKELNDSTKMKVENCF
ncbi:hypothetical protein COOONC_23791 [Cooperia oncophora]